MDTKKLHNNIAKKNGLKSFVTEQRAAYPYALFVKEKVSTKNLTTTGSKKFESQLVRVCQVKCVN